jgi:hypothetical protein
MPGMYERTDRRILKTREMMPYMHEVEKYNSERVNKNLQEL